MRETTRKLFPSLAGDTVFLDNAGGSQAPGIVADAIRDFMLGSYVQPGADYSESREATGVVAEAHRVAEVLVNSSDTGHAAFGASTSSLAARLASCYADSPHSTRNEVVVAESGHEANVGPWARLEQRGWEVKLWRFDARSQCCPLEDLPDLIGERTRIVALPHVSNLLGRIEPVREVCKVAHEAGARVVVDGVAYAPHRAVDVVALEADWYLFSAYKVYGPHMGIIWGRKDAFAEITGPNHFFVPEENPVYRFELGGVPYESCAGMVAVGEYLGLVAGETGAASPLSRRGVEAAYGRMDTLERPLTETLLDYLSHQPSIRLVGPAEAGDSRVPTISFTHAERSSKEIATAANERGLGIRYGHFYAHRLAAALCEDPDDGVVRVSMVHYNTPEEISRLISFFEEIL